MKAASGYLYCPLAGRDAPGTVSETPVHVTDWLPTRWMQPKPARRLAMRWTA